MTRWILWLSVLLVALYAPTLAQGFHLDDFHMVVNNQFIKDWSCFPQVVSTASLSSVAVVKGMYRPVLMASYFWNYQTGGLNPFGYHLVNIWLHLLAACSVVGLSLRLWPSVRPLWVVLGAALWAVHPVHTEAVAYVASRSSVLATLWMVLALLLYRAAFAYRRRRKVLAFLGSIVSYGLALGSKEIAVTLPGLLLWVEWRMRRIEDRRLKIGDLNLLRLLPFLLLTGLYLLWRKILIGAVGVVYPVRPWRENTLMQLEGILSYLRLWFWPVNQTVAHAQPAGAGIWPWASLLLLIGLGLIAWRARKRLPGVAFALRWAGITFLPMAFASSLNLVVAEHHLYLPSVGIALGLPQILEWLSLRRGSRNGVVIVCLLLVGILGVATVRRNLVWRDSLTLWADAARKNPANCMVQNNLGVEYAARDELEDAFLCSFASVRLARDPFDESTVRNNLGNLYLRVKQPEQALAQFRRCLAINPVGGEEFYNNMGLAYVDLGSLEKAEEAYTRALDADPRYIPACLNFGVFRFRQSRWEEGGRLFERAVRLDPDHEVAALALGKFYLSQGRFSEAAEMFRRLIRLAPHGPTGYLYLAVCALRVDLPEPEQAHRYLTRAKALGWEPDKKFLEDLEQLGDAP